MVFYQVKGRGSYGHGRTWKESYQREVWKVLPDSGERMRVCKSCNWHGTWPGISREMTGSLMLVYVGHS